MWQKVWKAILDQLGLADQIDWSKSVVDSSSVRALFGRRKLAPNPTDRRKTGSKRHIISDGKGIPLAVIQTGANEHDSQQFIPLVDSIPAIKRPGGGKRRRLDEMYADRAYDAEAKIRRPLRLREIIPKIARRHVAHGSGLGRNRCIIESDFACSSSRDDSESDTKNETTSTKIFSPSDVSSSAGTDQIRFVRASLLCFANASAALSLSVVKPLSSK